jgi:hypothetical protein
MFENEVMWDWRVHAQSHLFPTIKNLPDFIKVEFESYVFAKSPEEAQDKAQKLVLDKLPGYVITYTEVKLTR